MDGSKTLLQLGRIISNYAQGFSKSDPQIAFHYLFSLTLQNSREYANFCHSLVCNLALETKDFGTYLGTFRTDGTKCHGFLERYLGLLNLRNESEFYQSIVLQAAKISENEGHVEDALNLYNLSKDYSSVLSLLSRKLSESMMKPSDNLAFYKDTCSHILGYYESLKSSTSSVDPLKMDTCRLLLKLVDYFRLFSELKYEGALSAMETMNLVPLDGDTNLLGRRAESLKSLDDTVSRHFGEIIVSLMTCIVKLYESLKHSPYFDSAKQTKMQWLRKKSRVLLTFSGMVPFRMPQEIFAKLNRMDINLG